MPLLAIDPTGYVAASATFGIDLAGGVTGAYDALKDGLAGTGSMAGHDAAGRGWGTDYDSAMQNVAEAIAAVQRACVHLASMLQHTGFNHCLAETDSNLAHRSDVVDLCDYRSMPELYWLCGDFPTSAGGSGDYPTGWSLVRSAVGFEWPDGRPAALRRAGRAWMTAGRTLDAVTSFVDDAVASIAEQRSPEVFDATIACRAMRTHVSSIATACTDMGRVCTVYAQVIDEVHQRCLQLLADLASDVETSELAGMIFAGETEGGSEDVALEASASRVAEVALQVAARLSEFSSDVDAIVGLEFATGAEMSDVTSALQPILTNVTSTASTTVVAGGPLAATQSAELLATRRLSVAAQINWAGIEAADRAGGHTQREHVGKSDQYLISRAQRARGPERTIRRSTFNNLTDAQNATAQNIAANTNRIDAWLKSGSSRDLPISSAMDPTAGKIYVKSRASFVKPSEVVTVLRNGPHGYFVLTSYPET